LAQLVQRLSGFFFLFKLLPQTSTTLFLPLKKIIKRKQFIKKKIKNLLHRAIALSLSFLASNLRFFNLDQYFPASG